MRNLLRAISILLYFLATPLLAASPDSALPVTFGPLAGPDAGDNDHSQFLYLYVPAAVTDTLYLRLFDPDVGGLYDEQLARKWDTTTRFRLLGGDFDRDIGLERTDITQADAGTMLAEREFGADRLLDDQWLNLVEFTADQGQQDGDGRLFKVIVDGINGDDGNVFDLAVSLDSRRNIAPEGLRIFSYVPTVQVPRGAGRFGEARFFVPAGMSHIQIHNFDLESASVEFQTPFRELGSVESSQSGAWVTSDVELAPWEQGRENAISLGMFPNSVNDATFYVMGSDDQPLTFDLPIRLQRNNSRPEPLITTTVLSDCRTVVYDASSSRDGENDALSFDWDFEGTRRSGSPITQQWQSYGRHEALLVISDSSGAISNSSRTSLEVMLNLPPEARIAELPRVTPGQVIHFDGSGSSDPDGQIVNWFWEFGDGSKATGATVDHAYAQPGYYRVRLRVRDDSGSPCAEHSTLADVWVNATPLVVAGPDRRVAVGETIELLPDHVFDSDSQIEDFRWDFGDGKSASGRAVEHAWSAPGSYTVTLDVDDGSGTANSAASDSLTVIVNDPPVPEAGPDWRVATGVPIRFDGGQSYDPDGQIIHYRWEFGDGNELDGRVVDHAYAEPGVYEAILSVVDDSGTQSDLRRDSTRVVINHPPLAEAGPDQDVYQSEVQFDASASSDTDGEITRYDWQFGDGRAANGVAPRHVFGNPGEYQVDLQVTDDSATTSQTTGDSLRVRVNAGPIADAGPPVNAAPGQVLVFNGNRSFDPDGSIAQYHWNFGDGDEANWATIGHAFEQPGIYQVRLRVRDDSGHEAAVDEAVTQVHINAQPVASIRPLRRIAPGEQAEFDGGLSFDPEGGDLSYRWTFSDSDQVLLGARVQREYPLPGVYQIWLEVDDGLGLANSTQITRLDLEVNHAPEAIPGQDRTGCDATLSFDGSASLDADGDALSYRWDFGDGTGASGGQVVHTYTSSGVYPVLLTVDDGQGLANSRHSASFVATVNQAPIADAGENRTVCAGDVVVFNGARSIDPKGRFLKYHWDFGNGSEGEGISPTYTYRQGGIYAVQLEVKDDTGLSCGQDLDELMLQVAESPIAEAGQDLEVCANSEVKFDGSGSRDADGLVNSFAWDFGDGTQGGGATPTHMYLEAGEYQVSLAITGDQIGNCDNSDKDSLRVKVHSAPRAVIEAPAAAATAETVSFSGAGSDGKGADIVEWSWDFGDGNTGSGREVEHAFEAPGRYFVTLNIRTDSGNQCDNTSQRVVIVVNAQPQADAGPDRIGATHQELVFDASGTSDSDGAIAHYLWDFGDGTEGQGVQLRHAYREPGVYQVTLKVEDDSGQINALAEDQLEVRINHPPQPVIALPEAACVGEAVTLDASASSDADGSIIAYDWQFGDGTSAIGERVEHLFLQPGTYQVALQAGDDSGALNGTSSAMGEILVNRSPNLALMAPRIGCPDEVLVFDATASIDPEGAPLHAYWDFGDNTTAAGLLVEHAYTGAGRYRLELMLDDTTPSACAETVQQQLLRINARPLALAEVPQQAWVGGALDHIRLNAEASSDADGDRLSFHWDLGDGSHKSGPRVYHRYAEPGDYTVRLRVRDDAGSNCSEASAEYLVKARRRPPEGASGEQVSP